MIGLVITGGEAPGAPIVRKWVSRSDIVIAADSGLDTAVACGVSPDLIVGDMDSVSSTAVEAGEADAEILRFARDKDETDTEIGCRIARERGADTVVILGGGGGRMSHFIGILSMFDRSDAPTIWVTKDTESTLVEKEVRIEGRAGEVISFFPLGCGACRMTSEGLRWPLDGIEWTKGHIGVSNELVGTRAVVRMISGRLLMVRDRQESNS